MLILVSLHIRPPEPILEPKSTCQVFAPNVGFLV